MLKWLQNLVPGAKRARQDANFWQNWHSATGDEQFRTAGINGPREALTYAAVYQAVSLISGDIASLPLTVTDENENPDDSKSEHPAYFVVRRMPSPGMPARTFWRRFVTQWLLWGNAYAEIVRDARFRPIELRLIPSQYIQFNRVSGFYEVTSSAGFRNLFPAQVFACETLSLTGDIPTGDTYDRLDTWRLANLSWALGLSGEQFAAAFFARGAQQSGVLEVPASMSKDARDRLSQQVTQKYGGLQNAFKVMVLRDGAKWQNTQVAPVDAELNALRDQQVADVARWYNLPPEKLGLPLNVSYGSLIEQQKAYAESTLGPYLRSIQSEAWTKLLTTAEQRAEETFFIHDLRPLFEGEQREEQRQPRPNEQEPQPVEMDQ